jgi:trimeric autotransporter adhesin
MNPLIQQKTAVVRLLVALACFTLSSFAQAVNPPPDGGYPGQNTAEGENALFNLTTGEFNTATGYNALTRNTTGDLNTATGSQALLLNTIGGSNTATGANALFLNGAGSVNTANGAEALYHNTTAFFNTAMGYQALYSNRTGLSNTANGYEALFSNITSGSNTANGVQALYRATGGGNIALGFQAGVNLTTGNNNIDIGNTGVAGESNKIRIGRQGTHNGTFIAGISGVAVSGTQVVINAVGKLGVATSSVRFKEDIKPMDKASETIHGLKPVTFSYKKELDAEGIQQFGLVAEEVEKVNPDLVARDADGKPYTVRYDAVNAMLLNEFLKEHRKNEEQRATIAQLKKELQANAACQQKQIEALTAGLQKVSAQLEVSKSAPQTVLNNH